ncbi:MAG: MFS transporter [Stackebrandtia sp.]
MSIASHRSPGVLRQPAFRRLWLADAASEVAFRLAALAVPLLAVLTLDATAFQVSLLHFLQTLGALLFSLIVGVWADRVRCRPLLIAADLGRAAALLTVPLAAWFDGVTFAQLCGVVFVAGVLQTVFNVASGAYLPRLLSHDDLVDANSKLAANASVAAMIGAGGGGVLVQLLTAPFALLVAVVGYAASAVQLLLLKTPETAPRRDGTARPGAEIAEGLRFVFGHPVLRVVATSAVVGVFFQSAEMAIGVVFQVRVLGLSAWAIGLLGMISLVGAIASAGLTPRLAERLGSARALLLAGAVYAAGFALLPFARPGWAVGLFAAGNFLASFGVVTRHVLAAAARQQLSPPQLVGRAGATQELLTWGVMPLGSLAGGILATVFSLRATLWVVAAGTALSGLILLLSPLRRMRDLPRADEEKTTV